MRRLLPLQRDLTALANDLDRLSRRAHALAAKVGDKEHDSTALQSFLAKVGDAGARPAA